MTKKQYIQACIMALVMLVSVVLQLQQLRKRLSYALAPDRSRTHRLCKRCWMSLMNSTLDRSQTAFSRTGGAQERLMTFIISGASPEVAGMSGYGLPIIAQGGLPLNEFAERDNLNLRIFNSVDLAPFQYKDATYALPITSGVAWTNLMIYNKRLMAEVGLNPNAPPETWEQWRIAARRTTRKTDGSSSVPVRQFRCNSQLLE